MRSYEIEGVPTIKLWAETPERARQIAEELEISLGADCDLSYPRYLVFVYGEPLNGPGWGLCCASAQRGLAFLQFIGILNAELEKAPRKEHSKRQPNLLKIQKAGGFRGLVIRARKDLGWSQEDLAFKVGCLRQAINNFENGKRIPHRLNEIIAAVGLNPEMSKTEIDALRYERDTQ